MKLLLVNPNREQMPWPVVPLGLSLVAGAAERAGHRVRVVDLTFRRAPERALTQAARRFEPDVVGLTVRNIDNCNLEHPVFYLRELRDRFVPAARRGAPGARLVVGGAGVNIMPEQVRAYVGADAALYGEGEQTLPAYLADLEAGGEGARVPGVVQPGSTAAQACPVRLGALEDAPPSAAWRWIDLAPYRGRGATYPLQTKRGCALRCSYCVYNAIEGRTYRLRAPEAIVDEIAEAARRGIREIEIVDSAFNLPLGHAMAVCEALARRALPVSLTTMGLNPGSLTPELIGLMRRAGFRHVMCSAESGADATLQGLGKSYDREAVIRAAELLAGAGIRTFWYFILGAPGETMQTLEQTLGLCERWLPANDVVHFTTGLRVYPGTPLAAQLKDSGWFERDDPLLEPSWYVAPTVELAELYARLVRGVAEHPSWITNAETIIAPRRAWLLKRLLSLTGGGGPFWSHLPRLFALRTRLGDRGRALERTRAKVAAIEDLVHHRAKDEG